MGKLVILQLPSENFARGFTCILQIREDKDTTQNLTQITGKLPANPEMPQRLNDEWRSVFNSDESSRIQAKKAAITNFSRTAKVKNFVDYLNDWLNDSRDKEWQKIRDGLQQHLSKEEEIRVIIQTQDPILRRLPWQAWNLFAENYPKAEIALSPISFQTPGDLPRRQSKKVRILTVLGENTVGLNSPKIDIQFDQQELEKLGNQGAEIIILKQPSPEKLREYLWQEEGWHIFFFAGHSSSSEDGEVGEIILNSKEKSLKITELQEALKKAISRGLQLAIFNSCDGLGLANQLAELNIRQMIVMREPVPDTVAKAFLQHFLTAFACRNQSFYAAVREARLRLEDWEKRFPGAKWLPVIYQNPTVIPPTWKQLRTRRSNLAVERSVNSFFARHPDLSLWKFLTGLIGLGTVTVVFIVVFPYVQNRQQSTTVSNPSPPSTQKAQLPASDSNSQAPQSTASSPTPTPQVPVSTPLNLPSPTQKAQLPVSSRNLQTPQATASASPTVQIPVSKPKSSPPVQTVEPQVPIIPNQIWNSTFVSSPAVNPTASSNPTQPPKDSAPIQPAKNRDALNRERANLLSRLQTIRSLQPTLKQRWKRHQLLFENGAISQDMVLSAQQEYLNSERELNEVQSQLNQLELRETR